ncbi:hypothetical protein KBC59_03430 [Patescibacteria group bacterium]|nr:hypothetical protein [Patescibacteria group bacterium]
MSPHLRSRLLVVLFVLIVVLGFAAAKIAVMSSSELQLAWNEIARLRSVSGQGEVSDEKIQDVGNGRYVALVPSKENISQAWVIHPEEKRTRPASASADGVWSPTVSSTFFGDDLVFEWNGEGDLSVAYEVVDAKTDAVRFAVRSNGGQSVFLEKREKMMTIRLDGTCEHAHDSGETSISVPGIIVNETRRIAFNHAREIACEEGPLDHEHLLESFGALEVDLSGRVRFAIPGGGDVEVEMNRLEESSVKIVE